MNERKRYPLYENRHYPMFVMSNLYNDMKKTFGLPFEGSNVDRSNFNTMPAPQSFPESDKKSNLQGRENDKDKKKEQPLTFRQKEHQRKLKIREQNSQPLAKVNRRYGSTSKCKNEKERGDNKQKLCSQWVLIFGSTITVTVLLILFVLISMSIVSSTCGKK